MFTNAKQRGFSLIEIMFVVTIIGLLAAMAFPTYMDHVRKARRTDAENALMRAVQRMELQFARNATYVGATLQGGGIVTQSTDGYYTITITNQGVNNYTLQATPNIFLNAIPAQGRISQNLDPVIWFQINAMGQKTHARNDGVPAPPGWKSP
jgi:type IV pilus assembly protein PilE